MVVGIGMSAAGLGVSALVAQGVVYRRLKNGDWRKTNPRLLQFIRNLYEHLERKEKCFLSGAFVFEDERGRLFQLLYKNISRERLVAMTHKAFGPKKQYEIDFRGMEIRCGDKGENKNVMLFYEFQKEGKRYVFMKLERTSYAERRHLLHLATGLLKKKKSAVSRRGEGSRHKIHTSAKDYSGVKAVQEAVEHYDRNVRKGNEFFVPAYFLNKMF